MTFQLNNNEPQNLDPKFYDRADNHINLSNDQLKDINPGKVSASMMYATARLNAYVSWIGFDNADDFLFEFFLASAVHKINCRSLILLNFKPSIAALPLYLRKAYGFPAVLQFPSRLCRRSEAKPLNNLDHHFGEALLHRK